MNEREIIERLTGLSVDGIHGLIRGIGDDCAVIEKSRDVSWLVTMDSLVEGIHFDLNWHPPHKLARKSVAVNMSDIAAMGGTPVFVFLSLALPAGFDPVWLQSFAEGIRESCLENDCLLAGGDTVASREGVLITITVIGEIPADQVLLRKGALPCDMVWVSGSLGIAAAGLEMCRRGMEPGSPSMKALIDAHLDPRPRVRLGRLLAESGIIHAMMDLSDGLATDLSHLCRQSDVGAVVRADLLPAAPDFVEACRLLNREPLEFMLQGGEDYELLFTTAPDAAPVIHQLSKNAGLAITPVGEIVQGQGVRLLSPGPGKGKTLETDISFSGFDHFPGV